VNFIKHFLGFMDHLVHDTRLTPHHVSLYITLFQYWNLNHFRNPVSISREEVMRISKIGSVNTYVKCLKDLDAWQYIKYMPSFNPQRGSKVHLYRFDKGTDKAGDNADNTAAVQPVSPSINTLNNTNIENREKDIPPAHQSVYEFFKSKNASETEAEKFFAHYQANGWRLSGRTPMQDWQAAATKWILNINSFSNEREIKTSAERSRSTPKDYSEPL
jgi:hypothetical protein